MRIFTCTPRDFSGAEDFFTRDSGLLCRGLQAIGVFSRAVMPGARMPEDQDDLIRTEYLNLESAEWWRAQRLDGVVLYAWGRPRFRKVAAAIREAGIFLVLNQDNGGLVSPLAGFRGWLSEQRNLTGGGTAFIMQVVKGLSYGLLVTDPLRARHLKQGDLIACVSPKAADHYRRLCRIYGGRMLAGRVRVIPHAVESRFYDTGEARLRRIACVGRWQDAVQKRPWLLIQVLDQLLDCDTGVEVLVAGKPDDTMLRWHRDLPESRRTRVVLAGMMGRDELAKLLIRSQIFYSPSAYESFGIAAAEALCAGCSVVASRSVSMNAFDWFVSENSGQLTTRDDAMSHVAAILAELKSWDTGQRSPQAISATWRECLHADRVADRVVKMISR
jgi:glycosyltransferase involved in cell wall biosynthesis